MKDYASPAFWRAYEALDDSSRKLAAAKFRLLKADRKHPSLRLKRTGRYWSVRAGGSNRALATEVADGLLWFWIGSHDQYERILDC